MYGLYPDEQQLIEDTLVYGIGFFNWAKQKNRKPYGAESVRRPGETQLETYAKTFIKTVSPVLKVKRLALNATVYKNGAPLTVVSFHVTDDDNTKHIALVTQADAMRKKLRELDSLLLKQQTPSMYIRRHVRIYDGNQVSLVRPSEKRFWTQSQACVDADAFINELLS
jgi:hypothetical protein